MFFHSEDMLKYVITAATCRTRVAFLKYHGIAVLFIPSSTIVGFQHIRTLNAIVVFRRVRSIVAHTAKYGLSFVIPAARAVPMLAARFKITIAGKTCLHARYYT